MSNITRKSQSVTPVTRTASGITFTSDNQQTHPIVYSDDVWAIVKSGTNTYQVVSATTGTDANTAPPGTYSEDSIIEAISKGIVDINTKVAQITSEEGPVKDMIVSEISKLDAVVFDEDDGVRVEIRQKDGLITEVNVDSKLIGSQSDPTNVDTINAAKNLALSVLGTPTDTSDNKTVYGAFSAVLTLIDSLNSFKPITEAQIRALFACG